MKTEELLQKQAKERAALENEFRLESLFTELCGITPSIISPGDKPFAVFRPKNADEYLSILNTLQSTNENATVTFAGKAHIDTFSPYLITYGGRHKTPNYMEVFIKYKHSICPIWVKMPDDVMNNLFSVTTLRGEHKAFGRYETEYTLSANHVTKVQHYYGDNKTMYAATEEQATQLKDFIYNL